MEHGDLHVRRFRLPEVRLVLRVCGIGLRTCEGGEVAVVRSELAFTFGSGRDARQ